MFEKLKLMLGFKWKPGDGIRIDFNIQYDPSQVTPKDFDEIKKKINVELNDEKLKAIQSRNLARPVKVRKAIKSCE